MTSFSAFGVGLATRSATGRTLDTWYPTVGYDEEPDSAAVVASSARVLAKALGYTTGAVTRDLSSGGVSGAGLPASDPIGRAVANAEAAAHRSSLTQTERVAVVTFVDDLSAPPVDVHDVYLRLHLLSHRLVQPHVANLDGAFGLLNNVVWTDLGPCDPEGFESLRLTLAASGHRARVTSIDKFPRMTDYVVPGGIRIGDAERVRLGAHLAAGTTVMHEGFVNFNAGTLGASMVEGRISAGVVVGDGSDLGGGCSIMGTLSGGGTEVIRIGERCLVGANAGVGISLGDDCVVEAGLYLTAGTKVAMTDGSIVKASSLSGRDGMLFRRDSQSGQVVALPRTDAAGRWDGLNAALHAN